MPEIPDEHLEWAKNVISNPLLTRYHPPLYDDDDQGRWFFDLVKNSHLLWKQYKFEKRPLCLDVNAYVEVYEAYVVTCWRIHPSPAFREFLVRVAQPYIQDTPDYQRLPFHTNWRHAGSVINLSIYDRTICKRISFNFLLNKMLKTLHTKEKAQ